MANDVTSCAASLVNTDGKGFASIRTSSGTGRVMSGITPYQEVIVLQELSALLAPRRVLAAAGSLRGQQEEQQRQEASS